MKKTVVVYGSSTGTCESIANTIADKLGTEAINVADMTADTIADNDVLLLGWYDGIDVLKEADLEGKTVAIFGCGDAESYPDTFCGAMGEIYNAVSDRATVVGGVSTDDYTFDDSEAVQNGQFVGLALDDVNESDKTEARIDAWIASLPLE